MKELEIPEIALIYQKMKDDALSKVNSAKDDQTKASLQANANIFAYEAPKAAPSAQAKT
jgi:hypothetical protein